MGDNMAKREMDPLGYFEIHDLADYLNAEDGRTTPRRMPADIAARLTEVAERIDEDMSPGDVAYCYDMLCSIAYELRERW